MTTEAGLITDEELIHMPDDGYRYELVRGELVQKPLPGHRHGRLVGYLAGHLGNHVETEDLGIAVTLTGYLLGSDPDTVRAPDGSTRWVRQTAIGLALPTLSSRSSPRTTGTRK